MSDETRYVYVQALALGLAPEWRRCPPVQRAADVEAFADAERGAATVGVRSVLYSSVGLEPGVDLVLWRSAETVDALELAAAATLRCGLGTWATVRDSFIGRTSASQYVAKPSEQEAGLLTGERNRYLIVYPFTKSTDWYLLSREARQGVMNEHMKVGHGYPTVRQALAYSFGLDDQDFLVAYETDDLPAFGDLVRELRGTDSRRSTVRDTPILLGIHRPVEELAVLLGAS
jgi:chlorite dismutase